MNLTDPFRVATLLSHEGRFVNALTALNNLRTTKPSIEAEILRAELLEKLGDQGECEAILQRIRSLTMSDSLKSACELVWSRLANNQADYEAAIRHLQRSMTLATKASDLAGLCRAQLRLVATVADRSGPDAASALLFETRRHIARHGDPRLTAALHLTVGELEGRRGLLNRAEHHARIVCGVLKQTTDLWCQAWVEIHLLSLCCLRHEFESGLEHGRQALRLSEESGAVALRGATLGNLGNLYRAHGQAEKAIECLESAAAFGSSKEQVRAIAESIASIRLSQGRVEECDRLLTSIEQSNAYAPTNSTYVNRHARLTRARWFIHKKHWSQALETTNAVIKLAAAVEDVLLLTRAKLTLAEILSRLGNTEQALATLSETVPVLPVHTPDIYGEYEIVLAIIQEARGEHSASVRHFERAHRVLDALHDHPGLIRLTQAWKARPTDAGPIASKEHCAGAATLLHDVASAIMHHTNPPILARDLLAILSRSSSVLAACTRGDNVDGSMIIERCGENIEEMEGSKTVHLGSSPSDSMVIRYWPRADGESAATVGAFEVFVDALRLLRQAHAEREERLTLWPVDDPPIDGTQAVVNGEFRKLLTQAQRVANADVTVLIAGESGTGKEILARAIHQYSSRADKPFVPFNCTAVPRDLLESQLFGYRRGAFTGADRDSLGLIRSASNGTLFLDEIGELSLDLQPKLLRFLESGEIAPLGDTSSVLVDVRIVAATNANLDQLVQAGRFRDDLFYRLNVIRLIIPPLRQRRDEIPELVHRFVAAAAQEFGKGNMGVAEDTMEYLLLYRWPGNVRQLKNELRAMVALAETDSVLKPSALSAEIRQAIPIGPRTASRSLSGTELTIRLTDKLAPTVDHVEREMIQAALRAHPGRMNDAARALGISRKGLYLKRQRLGL